MALRRHGEVRGEARAREREKSRGGAEEEVDSHTCCRSTRAASVHPRGAKVAGRCGDDGDAEAEGEDEGSSRFCPPRGDDSPAHTRPTRAASQSSAARGGELEGDPAEGWPTSPTQCRRRPPRPPETTTTTPSSQPASSLLGLL
uniref:Uncharacterized protein n=1 Tax=Oryza meridionalis TaxID=40149 RepID=A0A0E0DA27_9ORYZ